MVQMDRDQYGKLLTGPKSREDEIRDAALMEAAKAVCPVCNDGEGINYDTAASVFRHQYSYRCDASEIHRLRAGKEGR